MEPCTKTALTGVVLAGGKSSRMGTDKRKIRIHGRRPMLLQALHLLSQCTDRVVISCREDSIPSCASDGQFLCVFDALPTGNLAPAQTTPSHIESFSSDSIGPLAGMYACLQSLGGPLLVLSCDMPFMTPEAIRKLIAARQKALENGRHPLMTTYRQAETGFIEALVAIYEAESLPLFAQAIRDGTRKLNKVIPASCREDIVYSQDEALPFFNVNYPADLALAMQASKASE